VRTLLVIAPTPRRRETLRVNRIVELLRVQELVPKTRVERFREPVLQRDRRKSRPLKIILWLRSVRHGSNLTWNVPQRSDRAMLEAMDAPNRRVLVV
jgi:hypothetical protein